MTKSITRAELYRHLDQNPGATVRDVCHAFNLPKESAWAKLHEMEKLALLKTERDMKATGRPMSYYVV